MTNMKLRLGLVAMTAGLLVSCMDDKYDLDNVDMTIGTSGDLTLPQSSTGEILLRNILDIDPDGDGIVKVSEGGYIPAGDYYLKKTGTPTTSEVEISPITIKRPKFDNIDASVDWDDLSTASARGAGGTTTIDIDGYKVEVPNRGFTYTIRPKDKAYYELKGDDVKGSVPQEITALKEVTLLSDTKLDIKLTLSCGSGYDFINRVHLDNFTVNIPKGLHVSAAQFTHYSYEDNQHMYHTHNIAPEDIDNENGHVILTREDKNTMLREDGHNDHEIHMILTFDKAVVSGEDGENGLYFKDNWAILKGKFEINGSLRIETEDFLVSKLEDFIANKLTTQQKLEIITTQSLDAICPRHFEIGGWASFRDQDNNETDISVASFSGTVETSVGDIAPIALDDLPDFLNDEDVRLDLANPVVYVKVSNQYPGEAKTGLRLTSIYDDSNIENIGCYSGTIILPEGESVLCVAEDVKAITTLPSQYEGMRRVDVTMDGLSDLLVRLPKSIAIDVEDITLELKKMPLPAVGKKDHYTTKIEYDFYTPLELGEKTKLVYSGEEEGISKDLEDINTLNTKAIEITATAKTNFPLELVLSVDAKDKENVSLTKEDKIVTVDDVVIPAHQGTEPYSYQEIRLQIKPTEGHTISDLLKRMDKFVYRAETNGGGQLRDNASLKLTNVKITLKGGVSYDAN